MADGLGGYNQSSHHTRASRNASTSIDDFFRNNDDDGSEHTPSTSYLLQGYTPLNFHMNEFSMLDDSSNQDVDDGYDGENGESFSHEYFHVGVPNRLINGVKDHVSEYSSFFESDERDAYHQNERERQSDTESEDLVPDDFYSLAENALRGLEEEHRCTLERSDQVAVNCASTETNITSLTPCLKAQDNDIHPNKLDANSAADYPTILNYSTIGVSTDEPEIKMPEKSVKPFSVKLSPSVARSIVPGNKEIDLNAIQRAMQSIRKSSPLFATTLDERASLSSTTKSVCHAALIKSYAALISSTCHAIQESQLCSNNQRNTPLDHMIIPAGPLAAFRRSTPKAKVASHKFSRSATLAEGLLRLWPLICFRRRIVTYDGFDCSMKQHILQKIIPSAPLTIHIIGADHVECSSEESVRESVGPFVRWLQAALLSGKLAEQPSSLGISQQLHVNKLLIEFFGPNISNSMVGTVVDLLPKMKSMDQCRGLQSAEAVFCRGEYHDKIHMSSHATRSVDLAIAFNAGIWGYDSWQTTLASMMSTRSDKNIFREGSSIKEGILFVITAYTIEESEDDAEVIADLVKNSMAKNITKPNPNKISTSMTAENIFRSNIAIQLWAPQPNSFSSHLERETPSAAEGRVYFENGAWQAWVLGL